MSTTPITPTPSKASFFATSRKAFTGGFATAGTTGGAAIVATLADGTFTAADAWTVAGALVGGFVIGFAAVWRVPNDS